MSLPHTWIDTRDFYREECRKRGLHSSGSKGAMRARLEASLLDGAVGVGDAQLGVAAVVEGSMEVASTGLGGWGVELEVQFIREIFLVTLK